MNFVNELNKPQREACTRINGPVLILAGAGSGKTKTITHRIAHMVQDLKIRPENILAVSFTNKASEEMKSRVYKLIGKLSRKIHLSTFHSLGVKILKENIDKLGYSKNFTIYDSSDQISIIRSLLKNYKSDKKFDAKKILSTISFLKNNGVGCNDFLSSKYFDDSLEYDLATLHVYELYQEKLMFYNAIDFDDILYMSLKILHDNKEVCDFYSNKFRYIMIDEYQDTNKLQLDLVKLLTTVHSNICVVGDDDQSIYAFRGADVANILNFNKMYSDTMVVKLEQNYRSNSGILNLANDVIKNNKERMDKSLWTMNTEKGLPVLWEMEDTDHESKIIVDEIVKLQRSGKDLKNIAVLYRSNKQSAPIEDELRLSQVPYRVIGGQKFYEKKEIKDIIAYLSLMINKNDEISLRRIINTPNREIGKVTLDKILKIQSNLKCSLYKALGIFSNEDSSSSAKVKKFSDLIIKYSEIFKDCEKSTKKVPKVIEELIEEINFFDFIEKSYDSVKQIKRRKEDVLGLIESSDRFTKNYGEGLKPFVVNILLADSQNLDSQSLKENEEANEVNLLTFHSSKGLEFDNVFIVGVEEGLIPHKNVIINDEDISEERRLFYVGITRARQKLIMSFCKNRTLYGKKKKIGLSRFVLPEQINQDLILKQDRTKFEHLSENDVSEYKADFFKNLLETID
jgi:DNA helicase II / ATP-dependent DNA helicase PcrA